MIEIYFREILNELIEHDLDKKSEEYREYTPSEKTKENVNKICQELEIKETFEDCFRKILNWGPIDSTISSLDFILKIGEFDENVEDKMIEYVLKMDPEYFLALRRKVDKDNSKENLMRIIEVGKKQERTDLDRYIYDLQKTEDVPKDYFHAVRIGAYRLSEKYKHLKHVNVLIDKQGVTIRISEDDLVNENDEMEIGKYKIAVHIKKSYIRYLFKKN